MGSPSGTYRSPLRPPSGGAHAVLNPRGCKEARWNSTRRQGTLAAPVAAVARRLPRHGESSSMKVWTETIGPLRPPRPTEIIYHRSLTPVQNAPHRMGAHPLPFSRQSNASNRQRFTRTPPGRQKEHQAHLPPPSQGQRPTRCQGDHTPRRHGPGSLRSTQGLRKG